MTRGLALVLVGLLAGLVVAAPAPRTVPATAAPTQRVASAGAAPGLLAAPAGAASAPRAVLAAAAPADLEPAVGAVLVPAMPWPPPVATVVWSQPDVVTTELSPFPHMALAAPPPTHIEDPAPLRTREHPSTEVVGSRWYEPERSTPDRLYLERLLAREVVEGWNWDAGYTGDGLVDWREGSDLEALIFGFDGRMQRTTAKDSDGDFIEIAMVGPSMRWHPTDRTRFELSQMVGVGSPYPLSEVCVSYGCKF